MAENTKTEWTDAAWNPLAGCSIDESVLKIPLNEKKPTTWFVNSMSDLFHDDVPFDSVDKVFAVMARCPHHTFQVLTKRAERMAEYLSAHDVGLRWALGVHYGRVTKKGWPDVETALDWDHCGIPNVWLGVSCEDQQRADERIPHLLRCPAAVRFLSCEPLLGPIDILLAVPELDNLGCGLDWVIVGGESGPVASPCDLAWIRWIVKQCQEAGVPCFVKQWGSAAIRSGSRYGRAGTTLVHLIHPKGADMSEWPKDLQVREMPQVAAGE